MEDGNIKKEKRILNTSLSGCIFFVLAETVMAYLTGSHSILMDCIFDLADLIMIGPFLILVPLLYKPVTEKRPYGFSQMESLFVMIKYLVLLLVTCFLIIENIQLILEGGNSVDAGVIAIFELFVGFVCLVMYLILRHLSKKYSSPSIKAEVYIWKLDVISSTGVSLAFFAQILLEDTSFSGIAPYIDPVVAIVMAMFLIVEPVKMILKSVRDLLLFAPDPIVLENIKEIVSEEFEKSPYEMSFLDVIHTGRKLWIEIYIDSPTDTVSLSALSSIKEGIRKKVTNEYHDVYVEIIPE